jgi:hypothetical protein
MTAAPRRAAASALVVAVLAIVVGAAVGWLGWSRAPGQFFYSYLVACLYWLGLSLGSLSLLLLHNLTGGRWGDPIRPVLRATAGVLPVTAILFLPIVLKPERLYEWADASIVARDEALQHKQAYLNVDFFQIRAAIYLVLWLLLLLLLAWQARSAPLPETPTDRRFRRLSGQGLALHGLAITFASIDWMMSLEPHWFSTIYGVIVFASQGLTALALAILLYTIHNRRFDHANQERAAEFSPAVPLAIDIDAQHDQGKLLLGFLMFWAYVTFSQFLIIWYGNLPEEVVWYLKRTSGRWAATALAIALLHFVLPFALLLSRHWKREPVRLGAVALIILAMDWVHLMWMIEPAVEHGRPSYVPWLDLGLTAAIGGIWWLAFSLLLPGMIRRHTRTRSEELRHG